MLTSTEIYLSQIVGLIQGTVLNLFFLPFENTVTHPWLFLPELFFKKILKIFFKLGDFIKKLVFLKRCVDVVGLCNLIKI